MRVYVFTSNDGTLSVHRTPRGAYDAARVFLADQVNKAARYTQENGANPYEYYGEMGIINGFQDKPAETLEALPCSPAFNVLYRIIFNDKIAHEPAREIGRVTMADVAD